MVGRGLQVGQGRSTLGHSVQLVDGGPQPRSVHVVHGERKAENGGGDTQGGVWGEKRSVVGARGFVRRTPQEMVETCNMRAVLRRGTTTGCNAQENVCPRQK